MDEEQVSLGRSRLGRQALAALAVVAAVASASPASAERAASPAGAVRQQPSGEKAPSPAPVRAEIIVLHATNDHTGIDPKIGKLPELAKPPFSAYDSYKLLDRAEVRLARGVGQQRKLPDDGQLAVTLKDVTVPDKKGDPPRYSVAARIQKPGGKAFLPALEVSAKKGEIFFVAGQTYKGGILVIGIRLLG